MSRLLCILLLAVAPAWAATWYVDSSAVGSNNGTSRANAWTAFSGISTNAAAGDTIKVYRGTGSAYARWTVAEGGTDANTRIIVQGIDEGSGPPVSVGFNGAGFDYIAVVGMQFTQTSTATNYAMIAWNGAVGWLVQDNTFSVSYRDAITGSTTGNNNNIIRRNYFYDIGGIDDGAAAGASGTSLVNINGNSNLIEYNTSSLSMDRFRIFGTANVARNNYFGATNTDIYPLSSPYPFHSDGLQSFEGTLPLVQLLWDRNYDTDNRDTIGGATNNPNGHNFIVQDGGSNSFNWYILRFNVVVREADSFAIFRNISTIIAYNNTVVNMGFDKTTEFNNAVLFESPGNDIVDFRNNTFPYNQKMRDAAGVIISSNRTNFTSAANHSYNPSGQQVVLPTGASPANLAQSAPQFTDGDGTVGNDDYTLTSGSPLKAAGAYITLANGAGSGSTTLIVDDSKRLFDGWSIADADFIKIGSGAYVQISSINYGTNTVTLSAARTWSDNDEVDVLGSEDVGAYPFTAGTSATAPAISSGAVTALAGTATITVSDAFNVRFCEVLVDGLPVGSSYTPSGNVFTVTWTGDGSGSHTFTARAYAAWASATPTVDQTITFAGASAALIGGKLTVGGAATFK